MANDLGTIDIFVEVGITTVYTWNNNSINGMDISRSIISISRTIKFQLYIKLSPVLALQK